jgi:hypothetical protein
MMLLSLFILKTMVVVVQYGRVPWEIFSIDDAIRDDVLDEFIRFVGSRSAKSRSFAHEVSFVNGKELYPLVSETIWKALKPYVPDDVCKGPVDHVMYAVVDTGQGFPFHVDAGCVYDTCRNIFSGYTVLVYLTDDFEGGSLNFYDDDGNRIANVTTNVQGRIVCFDIGLYHAGAIVTRGTKTWLGTELLISRTEAQPCLP